MEIQVLIDGLCNLGLISDLENDFGDSHTDCSVMTEECFSCVQYADCLDAVTEID